MIPELFLDTETFSREDIRAAGTYRYAENAEIMLITYAIGDGPVHCWDYTEGKPPPDLVTYQRDTGCEVIAHHAMFDRNVLRLGNLRQEIPIEAWRCTMVQAMQHALPGGLDPLGKVLGLPQDMQKLADGKALIRHFCGTHKSRKNMRLEALRAVRRADIRDVGRPVWWGADIRRAVAAGRGGLLFEYREGKKRPYVDGEGAKHYTAWPADDVAWAMQQPDQASEEEIRYTRETHPAEWDRFVDYAKQDIVAMREIHRKLPCWNWTPEEIALWHLDQKINDRGFNVDRELVEAGARAAADEKEYIAERFGQLTGGLRPSQRDRVRDFLNTTYGMNLPGTAKHIMQPIAEDETQIPAVREIAQMVLESNKTSTAKYAALLAALSADGRFRGGLQFSGALRTRRWAGRVFQPHNLPSRGLPKEAMIEAYVAALKAGCHREMFDNLMLYGAAALRSVVIA